MDRIRKHYSMFFPSYYRPNDNNTNLINFSRNKSIYFPTFYRNTYIPRYKKNVPITNLTHLYDNCTKEHTDSEFSDTEDEDANNQNSDE